MYGYNTENLVSPFQSTWCTFFKRIQYNKHIFRNEITGYNLYSMQTKYKEKYDMFRNMNVFCMEYGGLFLDGLFLVDL